MNQKTETMRLHLASKLSSFISLLENIPVGWLKLFFIAEALISARVFLELVLSHFKFDSLFPLRFIFIHNWFWALFFSLIFFISYITKSSSIKTARLLLCGLPVIFIPLLSLIFGTTKNFTFIAGTWRDIFFHVSTFAAFHPNLGIFFAIEVVIFLAAVLSYFLLRTTIARSFVGIAGVYGVLIFFAIQGKIMPLATAEDYFLIFLFFNLLILIREFPAKAKALIFHLRPRRFVFLASFGVIMGMGASYSQHFLLYDFFFGFVLFSLLLLHAALINDIGDLAIDRVSNADRPYAQGIVSAREMNALQLGILGVIGALLIIIHSFSIAILTFFNIVASFLYSAGRFRKSLFSFLLVAFGESTAFLYGYLIQNPAEMVIPHGVFTIFVAFFFLFLFFLPVKDMKDIKGDSAEGVKNIMTLFGWKKGKTITAVSVFLGYLAFALCAGSAFLFSVALLFALGAVFLVLFYEKVGEQISFIHFFLFILSAAFILSL